MMQTHVRIIAQYYDITTGDVIDADIISDDVLLKAPTLKEFGYLHEEQINIIKGLQDFKLKHQILLNYPKICPICNNKTHKHGVVKSTFHAALTDHSVLVQRVSCKCGWGNSPSIEGIFGSDVHPDLLKKQALQGSNQSFEKSSISLNAESANSRAINNHSQIMRAVKTVSEQLEILKTAVINNTDATVSELIANIDGGHIKSRGENRSFEAMVTTVYSQENLKHINKSHNIITSKTTVASAKDDNQQTIKAMFKHACLSQGMNNETTVVCLADDPPLRSERPSAITKIFRLETC